MTEEVSKELFAKAEMALDCGQVMDGVDPRDILRLRPPTGSYASFEDWFHELEGFSLRSERAEGDIAWLRAAFDAGRSPTEAMGEVKALEWVAFDNGTAWAQTFVGLAYQARPDGWLFRNGALNAVDGGIGAAKAAAQADFELRISAHLSHPPAREAVDDAMVERACIRLQGGRE